MSAYQISVDLGFPQNEEPVAMGRSAPASCSSSKNGLCKPFQGRSIPSLQCLPATVPQIMKDRQTKKHKRQEEKPMKRVSILFIIMLLAIFHGYAEANQADHWEKVRQMEQLGDRFKAETGFRGNISYDLNRMCFGYYEGKFAGIQITAEADTASFRAAFEQILDKVLPYSGSNWSEAESLTFMA